ncbi:MULTISPECIES: hypothetical protein [unclassified Clostridium]|uniref:hypothetical protein n=1 Tax=unclassified Clostridium TaxID=2614128 RepID=UPI0025C4063C|nr:MULTISPECIES: hypothetical protein [unclassified Clostridium]
MAMKEGIFLHNTMHVRTDSFGCYSEQAPVIGFSNYGDEGKPYYSFDEVEELLKSGFEDSNIRRDVNGKLYLNSQYLSYCSSFKIVCSKVLEEITENQKGIYEYCKKIGLIKDNFVPVKGWFGTKEMSKSENDTFTIYYTFNNFDENNYNLDLAEKICVGKIKKLAGKRDRCWHGEDDLRISKVFECDSVEFNKANKQLIIKEVPLKYVTGEIVETIVALDLELWILFNDNKYWSRFFNASAQAVRDMGQSHWFSDLKAPNCFNSDNDKERNINWYERQLGEEWE